MTGSDVFDLEDRVIVITGAAGQLGRALAARLGGMGARLCLIDRSAEKLAAAGLADDARRLAAGGIDLSDRGAIATVASAALARFGRLDGLVATVGAFHSGTPSYAEDWATWQAMLDANLRSAVEAAAAIVPLLAAQGGRIVTIGARPGLAGVAGMAAYAAAKAALIRFTESLAQEVKDRAITVNCVLPSIIDTPANRAAMPKADHRRWVEPAALADVIAFLMSDAARAVTGASLPVYGRS